MKFRLSSLLVASSLLMASAMPATSYAQLNGLGGRIGAQAGNYNIQTYDLGALQRDYLNRFGQNQQAQKQFVINLVSNVNLALETFVDSDVVTLQRLADASASGHMPSIEEYLGAVRSFEVNKQKIQIAIGANTLVPGAVVGTPTTIQGSGIQNLPGLIDNSTIDFSKLIAFYNNQLEAIQQRVNGMQFMLTGPQGPMHLTGLQHPTPSFSPDQLKVMRQQVFKLKALNDNYKKIMNDFTGWVTKAFLDFQGAYGSSQEKHYFGDVTSNHRADAFANTLEEYYWARDYLRAAYGIQIGSVASDYQKRAVNLDILTTKTADLIHLHTEPEWDMANVNSELNNLQVALNTAQARSQKVFGAGVSVRDSILSAFTYVTGSAQLALVNSWLLELLANDMQSELIVSKGGGVMEMHKHYLERYFNTPGRAEHFKDLARKYDPSTDKANADDDAYGDTGVVNVTSINGQFAAAKMAIQSKYDEVTKAKGMQLILDQLTGNTTTNKNANTRKNDLQ